MAKYPEIHTLEEFQKAQGIALQCAKNVVEDLEKPSRVFNGTDLYDALACIQELQRVGAAMRRWWA